MANLRQWLARFRDRRKDNKPVESDRRNPSGREAKERLSRAHDKFQETVRNITGEKKFVPSNDRQQVVTFSSYRDICPRQGPTIGEVRFCRHPGHPEAANSAICICEENTCPRLTEALSAA